MPAKQASQNDFGSAPAQLQQPPEWAPQAAVWTAYPCAASLWGADLHAAQRACLQMCRVFAKTQKVRLLVDDPQQAGALRQACSPENLEILHVTYGDIWLRDTAPIFVHDGHAQPVACCFGFNGWGYKYWFDQDQGLNHRIAAHAALHDGCSRRDFSLILEGGSIDADGQGTLLTTSQCLCNGNRNPAYTQAALQEVLAAALGARHIVWLDEGLKGDHTDGHVDNVARFVGAAHVVCMSPTSPQDPNFDVLTRLQARLTNASDARGRRLRVTTVPSPGAVFGRDAQLQAASYLNFVIGNRTVVVPLYAAPADQQALQILQTVFPGRQVVGIDARAVLSGGGSFHCMTQPQFV